MMANKIYNTYLNIITETWNRFVFKDIVKATGIVTNNFKDKWVPANGPGIPTSKKVLEKLNASANIKYGSSVKQASELLDKRYITAAQENGIQVNKSNNYYDGDSVWDEQYVRTYWQNRAKSNDKYSVSIYNEIHKCTGDYAERVLAANVGKVAYGIWKALNTRFIKTEKNKQEVAMSDFNNQTGDKIENVDLVVTGISERYDNFNLLKRTIICTEINSGFKYKLNVTSNKIVEQLFQLLQYIEKQGYMQTFSIDPILEKLYNINISGKLKNVSIEYKSIIVSYVKINSLTLDQLKQLKQIVQNKIEIPSRFKNISDEYIEEVFNFFDKTYQEIDADSSLKTNTEYMQKVKDKLNFITQDQIYNKLTAAQRRQIGKLERLLDI